MEVVEVGVSLGKPSCLTLGYKESKVRQERREQSLIWRSGTLALELVGSGFKREC